jgi:hypothetical protein
MAMAMADGDNDGNGGGNKDGDGDCNGYGDCNGNDDCHDTDTREGCLFMCRQCASLWQGRRLASPPLAQKVRIAQCCAIWVPLQRVFAPFQREGILRAHHGLNFFIFFNYLFSLLHNPLFPHTYSVPQESHQPIDSRPRFLLYFFSR